MGPGTASPSTDNRASLAGLVNESSVTLLLPVKPLCLLGHRLPRAGHIEQDVALLAGVCVAGQVGALSRVLMALCRGQICRP